MTTATNHKPRTYRIVGPQRRIDERETPNFRAKRGEYGDRVRLFRETSGRGEVLRRTYGNRNEVEGGPYNSFQYVMEEVPRGGVNPNQTPVPDPAAMARKIKEIARYFGADDVGITYLDQAYVYSHRGFSYADGEKPGDPIHLPHKYGICLLFACDYDRILAANSWIADAELFKVLERGMVTTFMLASYIRELGYPAIPHFYTRRLANPIPLAVNAGLGELGRHGMLIHKEYGARVSVDLVTTDLPLTVDEPVDIGVEDTCKLCMKCARSCPSYSISFGDKVVINGVEKWSINWETCHKSKLTARDRWTLCFNCVNSCCYNKRPSTWYHTLAVWLVTKIPIFLRPFYIVPLLWADDLIWGRRPWHHMKWADYDNAPVPVTCKIPGCVAKHRPAEHKRLHEVPKPGLRVTQKGEN